MVFRNINRVRFFLMIALVVGLAGYGNHVFAQTGDDLTVHYIEGTPQDGQFAYDVSVYFSMVDGSGNPIRNLTLGDITVTEDGKQMDLTTLESTADEPIHIVIVMDTSGSMSGMKMQAARQAASRFISSLGANDQVALVSFNHEVKVETDFTDDLTAAKEKAEIIDAAPNAGTCFYDALYEAAQLSAFIPSGRRAIVILTDGVDEYNGTRCSTFTDADIISLASQGSSRVPIYTIGLGSGVDGQGLERIAALTGGRYQYGSDERKLEELFLQIGDQLRSQYKVVYVSKTVPGPHTAVLKVRLGNNQYQDSRNFVLPVFPYVVEFLSPLEGSQVGGPITLEVQVSGQGSPISQVEFLANGKSIGTVENPPYQLAWEPTSDLTSVDLDAVLLDADGSELTRSTLSVSVSVEEAENQKPNNLPSTIADDGASRLAIWQWVLIGVVVVVMLAVITWVLISAKRKKGKSKGDKEREREWKEKVQGMGKSDLIGEMDDFTFDGFTPSDAAIGVLVVLQSDDSAMQGRRIEITKTVTKLGRKADNDVMFPKDSPISRYHAVIEERDNILYLSEVMSTDDSGRVKRPTYGTFVNNQPVDDMVPLKDGDEIRLAKRVRLRFESVLSDQSSGDETLDQFSDDAETIDYS